VRWACAAQGESKARFVERVQQALAAELGIPISDVTLQAKRAMIAGERARAGRRRGMRR
jgi:6-phosphogluconolactonase/glucosamine-6-phosphate isomerase/deaminase